jgi:integrase
VSRRDKFPGVNGPFVKNGKTCFQASYFDGDKKRHREYLPSRLEAHRRRELRMTEIKEGTFVGPRGKHGNAFKMVAEKAINEKALTLKQSTIDTDRKNRAVKTYRLIGSVPIKLLSSTIIKDFLRKLQAEGLSPATLNRYRSFVSSVCKYAEDLGLIGSNPCKKVPRFREEKRNPRYLAPAPDDDEEKKIRAEIREDIEDGIRHEQEFLLALYTGMRRGELWGLKWADCNLAQRDIRPVGKTGGRHIPLSPDALKALEALATYTEGKEFVVVEKNEHPGVTRDFRSWFEIAVRRAGIKQFRYHDIRHTFASRHAIRGTPMHVLMLLMGHKSVKTTEIYAHLGPSDVRKHAEKLRAPK